MLQAEQTFYIVASERNSLLQEFNQPVKAPVCFNPEHCSTENAPGFTIDLGKCFECTNIVDPANASECTSCQETICADDFDNHIKKCTREEGDPKKKKMNR
jgi:hypothetical protein